MSTEVTIIVYDPRGRSAEWWEEELADVVEELGGALVAAEDQET